MNSSPVPLQTSLVAPQRIIPKGPGHWFIDFGRAAFGTVELDVVAPQGGELTVHLGEKLRDPAAPVPEVDREPYACVRYQRIALPLHADAATRRYRAVIAPDERNTGPRAILMPAEIGEVLPFRYCEIEGLPGPLRAEDIRQTFVHAPFDDDAASFESSSTVLNEVWDLCRHTIKATTFCGLYVDGDRERIPYEGDAYINQLSHYALDADYRIARATLEYLLRNPTWPTEWHLLVPFVAWYDFLYSGDDSFIREHYEMLKLKTFCVLAGENGLISTKTGKVSAELKAALGFDQFFGEQELRDMVDWPRPGWAGEDTPGETDGYVFSEVNTAVNALHYRAVVLMERMARHIGQTQDAEAFRAQAARVAQSLNTQLWDAARGVYVDGNQTDHASQHANFHPLMAGMVPPERLHSVLDFVKSRDMACSVYGSQHLLDGLYKAGDAAQGLALMTATHDRSWYHMIHGVGSTMTLEAWDYRYKPNFDWNHAWGAAPGNIIVRRLLGVRPGAPGFTKAIIQPQMGGLEWARARVPTPHGPIELEVEGDRVVRCELPAGVSSLL